MRGSGNMPFATSDVHEVTKKVPLGKDEFILLQFCHTCELECTVCFGIVTYVRRVVLVSLYFVNVRSY